MDSLIPTLALATFVLVVLFAIAGYVLFKRKSTNRHPMEKSPDGAIATVHTPEDR